MCKASPFAYCIFSLLFLALSYKAGRILPWVAGAQSGIPVKSQGRAQFLELKLLTLSSTVRPLLMGDLTRIP